MKIKINRDWLENNVFNHHPNVREIILDHGCVGSFEYNISGRPGTLYGVRVGFYDHRLPAPNHKFYVSPTCGNYEEVPDDYVPQVAFTDLAAAFINRGWEFNVEYIGSDYCFACLLDGKEYVIPVDNTTELSKFWSDIINYRS